MYLCMRKQLLIVSLLFSSQLFSDDNWCLNRYLALGAEFGYQRRQEGGKNKTLVVQGDEKVVKVDDLIKRMGWEYAGRASAVYMGSDCASLEAQYTYYRTWKARETVTGGNLSAPFDDNLFTFDFFAADEASVEYTSQLQNGEFNYWGHVTPQRCDFFSFSWIMGFRFIFLREKLDMEFERRSEVSNYKITTLNLLYGPQLGAVLEYNPNCSFTWTFMLKGAGFVNDAENKSLLEDDDNFFTLRDFTKKRWTSSWLIEGYGKLSYHLTSFLSFHFSYEGFLLTGLTLAPDQVDFSTSTSSSIYQRGQILIDGLFVGATLSF